MSNGALATTEQKSGGIVDLTGAMTGEMAARIAEMQNKLSLVRKFMNDEMVDGYVYGLIPGTGNKPVLLKPGAEKLCELYGFAAPIKSITRERDYATGFFLAEVVVQIVHRERGILIAEGVGECSSFESKYRYRWLFESEVKRLRIDPEGLVSKIFVKGDGTEYLRYRVENNDLIDQWNTVLKMAKKRALVDAVLAATRSSELFSRTKQELDAWLEEGEVPKPDPLVKKKASPTTADETHTFAPSSGSGDILSEPQRKRMLFDAEKKGVKNSDFEAFILAEKKKPIAELSKAEASAIIDWLSKVSEADLQDLIIDLAMGGGK